MHCNGKTFAFDGVLDPSSQQEAVYDLTASSLLERFLKGFNCTILAYGQTGSGKTFTMGTEETRTSMTNENRGIIPRLVEAIFRQISELDVDMKFKVFVSMLEIYDEKVVDLLSGCREPLQVLLFKCLCTMLVQGLSKIFVGNLDETMAQLEKGGIHRSKGETAMNAQSSRSHAVFTIFLEKTGIDDEDTNFTAKLHLVDLAGSERLKKTQAEGTRKMEGIRINEGLLALGNVISALSESGGGRHIPYRDSKITRLLQDSLGGNSYTVMIACVSPADTNAEETLSTLRYADRAKKIKNKPVVNVDSGQQKIRELKEKVFSFFFVLRVGYHLTHFSSILRLAEERRKKLSEMEKQLTQMRKQMIDMKRLEKQKLHSEEMQKQMQAEITTLKQAKVRMMRQQREEAEKYRQWKLKHDRELMRLYSSLFQGRKRDIEAAREKISHNQQMMICKQKLEEAKRINKRLFSQMERSAVVAKEKQREISSDQAKVMHRSYCIFFVLCFSSSDELNKLQRGCGSIDFDSRAESRWKDILTLTSARVLLKTLFEQVLKSFSIFKYGFCFEIVRCFEQQEQFIQWFVQS
uniref:Kinesin-like protein n=1 Tax=Angiostrongylus cantonensis TaxID=6313 RepID=A0A0K0DLM9_ANGCA